MQSHAVIVIEFLFLSVYWNFGVNKTVGKGGAEFKWMQGEVEGAI